MATKKYKFIVEVAVGDPEGPGKYRGSIKEAANLLRGIIEAGITNLAESGGIYGYEIIYDSESVCFEKIQNLTKRVKALESALKGINNVIEETLTEGDYEFGLGTIARISHALLMEGKPL